MKKIFLTLIGTLAAVTLSAQVDRSKMPEPGPAPKINLEEPERFDMPNGLTVLVVEDHKLPRVSVQLSLDNAPVLEGEKAGVASMTGSLMGKGSKNIPKDAFEEEVDFMGATLFVGPGGGYASSLKRYFPRVLELMSEAALYPNFTQEEFDKEKAKIITGLKTAEKDASSIASRVSGALAYGRSHPYGEFTTEESVNNVTLADVERYYIENFVPANAYMVVVGDTDIKEVKALVEKHFTDWVKATAPTVEYSRPQQAQYTQVNFVDLPNAVQSEIRVQNLVDLKMKDPDYLAAEIANQILGGGGEGRLFLNLREDKGYTYGSYSSIGDNKWGPSRFQATAQVRNAVTDSSLVEILKEIDRISSEPVSDRELEIAKAKYAGNFVLSLEQPRNIASFALNKLTEDLPDDYYTNYLARLDAIDKQDVMQAAQKYFKPENARAVIVGKGSEVLENLEKVTFDGKSVPIKYYDKYATPAEKPELGAAVPAGITVQSVIDMYFEAIGGKNAVDQIQSLKLVYEGTAMGSTIKSEELRTADKYAQTTYMNGSPMMGVIAKGDELFMKQGANKVPLPETMKTDMQKSMGIFPEQGIAKNPEAKLSGIEVVDGVKAYRIDVPGEAVQASYFYDTETGLKIKEATVISINGQTQNQETSIKEYQEVDGIKFPSLRVVPMGPQQIESKLLEAVINYDVQESDFN